MLPDDGSHDTLAGCCESWRVVGTWRSDAHTHVARSRDQRVQDEIYNLADIQAGKARDPLLRGGDIVVAEQSGTRVALKTVKDLLPFAMFAALF